MLTKPPLTITLPQGCKLTSTRFNLNISIGGLVVEYSPATRVTRVRFPADAGGFWFCFAAAYRNRTAVTARRSRFALV